MLPQNCYAVVLEITLSSLIYGKRLAHGSYFQLVKDMTYFDASQGSQYLKAD